MWLKIDYREFHDVPRSFLVVYEGRNYLFDCPFDEQADDYPPEYSVCLMPQLHEKSLGGSWTDLRGRCIGQIGRVAVSKVVFDRTRRKKVESSVLEELLGDTGDFGNAG